jgi:hypothetical protein
MDVFVLSIEHKYLSGHVLIQQTRRDMLGTEKWRYNGISANVLSRGPLIRYLKRNLRTSLNMVGQAPNIDHLTVEG